MSTSTHHVVAGKAMSKNVTLDHVEIDRLVAWAKMARAREMRRYGEAAGAAVGSKLRAHRVAAVVAALLISFGAKTFFFSAPTAEAQTHITPSASMNVYQMQIDHPNRNNLPVQKIDDMTFVNPNP